MGVSCIITPTCGGSELFFDKKRSIYNHDLCGYVLPGTVLEMD
jgi:hypothetical protein